jgi:hypothetical protein
MKTINDGTRTLFESVLVPEIIVALEDFKKTEHHDNFVIIGGIALSYYVKPRNTQDIDVLILSDVMIPDTIPGFKKNRAHAFENQKTGVELEIVTPEYVGMPINVVKHIIDTSVVKDDLRIASPSGLVASKLFRLSAQDVADIIALINSCEIDLSGFGLPQDKLEKYIGLIDAAEKEKNIPPLGD